MRQAYLSKLYQYKPWLKTCVPKLKSSKLEVIQKNYPIGKEEIEEVKEIYSDPVLLGAYQAELSFIKSEIEQNKFMVREKKTDI